jgi:ferredoxin
MKVTIDPSRCRGHALCLSIAPQAFEFVDLEDRSVVTPDAEHTDLELLLAAARECPERAITVEEE